MNILALETATEACSVALSTAAGDMFSAFELAPRRHTELLPRMLEQVLKASGLVRTDIDCIALGNGPGAFTGVRIAAATAQGMAMGLAVPIVAVSSLAILAQRACERLAVNRVQAMLDARMGEIYSAVYRLDRATGLVILDGEEVLVAAAGFGWSGCAAAGPGIAAARAAGSEPAETVVCDEGLLPDAESLARLARPLAENGQTSSAAQLPINYLRNQVAWRK